jgi:hypothetical protein
MSQFVGQPIGGTTAAAAVRSFLQRRFYFFMSLVMALVVAYGFHFTIGANLFHPAIRPPAILWVHAATFVTWLGLFIVQTGLVTTRNVNLHKRLGLAGVALGAAVFAVGIATTIAMIRFHAAHPAPGGNGPAFAIVPFNDMLVFAALFGTAVALRLKDREAHRRLMLMATCVLTAAGWGRFPSFLVPDGWFYAGVDFLILLGVTRDLVVIRRVHPVYLYAAPAIVAGQLAAVTIFTTEPAWWMAVVKAIAA